MESSAIKLRLLTLDEAIAVQNELFVRYGGLPGIRDKGAIESVIRYPDSHLAYRNSKATLPELAAGMAYALVKQHHFNDANKRTAAVLIPMFMRAHGIQWRPRRGELVQKMVMMARSTPNEREMGGH